MNKMYVGVADAHGIESFQIHSDTTTADRMMLHVRADANRHRHAVFFAVALSTGGAIAVRELLNQRAPKAALNTLKTMAMEPPLVEAEGNAENSWALIPDPRLDPYHGGDNAI